MDPGKKTHYLTCPRHKSRQRKHIDVCSRCHWNAECEPYQDYVALLPPTRYQGTLRTRETTFSRDPLIRYIREELEAIIALLEGKSFTASTSSPAPAGDLPKRSDLLGEVKKKLEEIKLLCAV